MEKRRDDRKMKKYQDHYFKKAKQEQYPARSVYKLKEIQNQFKLFSRGQRVLDLGAAPGSWTMYAAEQVGPTGVVLGVDLQETSTVFPPQVIFLQDDVFTPSPALQELIQTHAPFDVIISDMAPKTTGVKFADQARSHDLCLAALALARSHLVHGGRLVVKVFMGPDSKALQLDMQRSFGTVKIHKPKSSRSESKEIFYVGLDFQGAPA